jgi:hypothetical protein
LEQVLQVPDCQLGVQAEQDRVRAGLFVVVLQSLSSVHVCDCWPPEQEPNPLQFQSGVQILLAALQSEPVSVLKVCTELLL